MKITDYFDRKLIEEFTIKPEVKAMSKADRLTLLDQLFKDEYQGKVVTFKMLEQELFVKTTTVTREHFGIYPKKSSFKGFLTKLNISASGGYIPLISDCEYVRSSSEKKPNQNKFHKNTFMWHYFAKEVLCEGEKYFVEIDVRENKEHQCVVYNVGMKPVNRTRDIYKDVQKNKKREPANSAPTATDIGGGNARADVSCNDIIPQAAGCVNREKKKSLIDLIADAVGLKKKDPICESKKEIER